MSRIILEHVTKRFGDYAAVNDLSLEIESGAFFSLLGPSGCGKTTTMRLIAGLETADEGRILIDDKVVFDAADSTVVPPGKRGIGMVFQNYALWPHMTVRENILFGLAVRKIEKADQEERLRRVLSRLQISELVDRYPSELSGGQQQRIALARELVTGAKVLLMDEPLSNLDAKLRIDMRVELKQLHEETGATVIYVTHDQIEALTLSSTMAVMKLGVMQQNAAPSEVFAKPTNLFVAQFMGHTPMNILPATIQGNSMQIPGGSLPRAASSASCADGSQILIGARPEELLLGTTQDERSISVRVESILPMGYDSLVRVSVEGAELTIAADERTRTVDVGDDCFVTFDDTQLHCFDAETHERLG